MGGNYRVEFKVSAYRRALCCVELTTPFIRWTVGTGRRTGDQCFFIPGTGDGHFD